MCRNITELRGLEPPATDEEVAAAARQYIRKVSGIRQPNSGVSDRYEAAVSAVADITRSLLSDLPERRTQTKTLPPLRRPEVRARLAAAAPDHDRT